MLQLAMDVRESDHLYPTLLLVDEENDVETGVVHESDAAAKLRTLAIAVRARCNLLQTP